MPMPQSNPDGAKDNGFKALDNDNVGSAQSLIKAKSGSSGAWFIERLDVNKPSLDEVSDGGRRFFLMIAHFGIGWAIWFDDGVRLWERICSYTLTASATEESTLVPYQRQSPKVRFQSKPAHKTSSLLPSCPSVRRPPSKL